MSARSTTILGKAYPGRAMMNSFAHRVSQCEHRDGPAAARRMLRWHDWHCDCGQAEHDFGADMTTLGMEQSFTLEPRVAVAKRARAA